MLADDQPLPRRSLRLLLDTEEGLEVIAEASDLTTVMRHIHTHVPDVLVLDLSMPKGSSIDAIRRLRERVPSAVGPECRIDLPAVRLLVCGATSGRLGRAIGPGPVRHVGPARGRDLLR